VSFYQQRQRQWHTFFQQAYSNLKKHPEMNSPAVRVLLASPDRCLLRHLSKFLRTFGYETSSVSDPTLPEGQLIFDPPDVLIMDRNFRKGDPWSPCRELRRNPAGRDLQIVAIGDDDLLAEFSAPLEAGVDEFLLKPIDHGELLTCLRSCVRRLEFERRMNEQCGVNPRTGLFVSRRFWEKLREMCDSGATNTLCMMIGADRFSDFVSRYGTHAGEAIERAWAAWLAETAPPGAVLGELGRGRFGAVLADCDEQSAAAWRETLRTKSAAETLELGGHACRLTASCAILPIADNKTSAKELQDRLLGALDTAYHSGGDCLLLAGDLEKDARSWAEFAAPGKVFEHTVARNIMTPCTVVLREDDTLEKASDWLRRTHLPALPVVDAMGKLKGMISASQIAEPAANIEPGMKLKKAMCAEVPSFNSDARMETLRDYFALNAGRYAVITEKGRPVGWIAPETLMALIRPIHRDSFAVKAGFSRQSEFLRVPDLSAT
jgi:PleD family two-component response regulator/CBS domain-containing protein